MRGLKAGENQLVPPPTGGETRVPSSVGAVFGARIGRPFESSPTAQVCLA